MSNNVYQGIWTSGNAEQAEYPPRDPRDFSPVLSSAPYKRKEDRLRRLKSVSERFVASRAYDFSQEYIAEVNAKQKEQEEQNVYAIKNAITLKELRYEAMEKLVKQKEHEYNMKTYWDKEAIKKLMGAV